MLMMSTHSLSVISSRSLACKALDYQLSRRFFFKPSCCYPECCGCTGMPSLGSFSYSLSFILAASASRVESVNNCVQQCLWSRLGSLMHTAHSRSDIQTSLCCNDATCENMAVEL